MVKEILCDLFKANADAIVHSANCQHVMGGGVARLVAEIFPEAYEADLKTPRNDINKLGTFSYASVVSKDPRFNRRIKAVINLYGQFDLGLNQRHTSYDALERGFSAIRTAMEAKGDPSKKVIALPYRMGSNLGGGDWSIVRAIIESVFGNSVITVLICNNEANLVPRNKASK